MEIEYSVIYKIDSTYLNSRGDKLCEYLEKWLRDNSYNVDVYTFVIEEDYGDLIIDYIECSNRKNCSILISELVEKVFKKLNIKFTKEQ